METTPTFSRRHPAPKPRKPTRITVPKGVSHLVKLVFVEMGRQRVGYEELEEISGVRRPALKCWRHRTNPMLTSIESVLNALGFDLLPVPRSKVLPPEVFAALRPAADALGLTMPEAIALAVEIAAKGPGTKSFDAV